MTLNPHKQQVFDLLKSLETGDPAPLSIIDPNQYIQHNLMAKDGFQGLRELLAAMPRNSIRMNTLRVFQDGKYVFTHSEVEFFGPKAAFDVYRYENGKIVEHWDNLQDRPTGPNPGGHSMTDGTTAIKDLMLTDRNKKLVRQFVEDVLVKGQMEKLADYFDDDHYIQHNPNIGDGLSGLKAALQEMSDQGIVMRYDIVHRVLGEGNFVLVQSEGRLAEKPTSFYDLFRVENGKLAEHWDTIETIPPKENWKNRNGKF